jgi:hypothetical protein
VSRNQSALGDYGDEPRQRFRWPFSKENLYTRMRNMTQLSLLELSQATHPDWSDREHIERLASDVVRDLGEHPPIDLQVVADYQGIAEIRLEPMTNAGSLTPEGRGTVMRLRATDSRRRRRFSGFHEVGHTFLPGYRFETQFRCDPEAGRRATRSKETLADTAASALLLPRCYFRSDLAQASFGLDAVVDLADKYDASIQATAHRFAAMWSEPVLLVLLEPRLKPRDLTTADPKLRVVWARGEPEQAWPYVPPHKSASDDGPLARALTGELVDAPATLEELSCPEYGLEVSSRLFQYRNGDGDLVPQVLAMYRRTKAVAALGRG